MSEDFTSNCTILFPINSPPMLSADLSVTKNVSSDTVAVGENLTYIMTVMNKGPSTATGVILTDILPTQVSLVSAKISKGILIEQMGTKIQFTIGTLASGENVVATIIVTANEAGLLTNTATVTGKEFDPNLANNTAIVSTSVCPSADVAVSIEGSENVAFLDPVEYTITVTNHGPSPATGVELRFLIDSAILVVQSSIPPDCDYIPCFTTPFGDSFGGTLLCVIGTMAPGESLSFSMSGLSRGYVGLIFNFDINFCNTAVVIANEADPDTANNTTTFSTVQTPLALESLSKSQEKALHRKPTVTPVIDKTTQARALLKQNYTEIQDPNADKAFERWFKTFKEEHVWD